MKKLVKWIKVLAVGIFYLVILGVALVLTVGLIIGILSSEMRFFFKPTMILLISIYAAIVFAAAWGGMRKSINHNFVAE
ncbi:hypothetical protein KJ866_01700 [Patescibacteria group bacterium]|nr:hypothetical protein [Patescibacteria group bacterium]MBU2219582.1 hypothetical protein [Patescibacteria group bacterium]MBU2264977.1 hypothetical protein [Patescibacteria group bacterium]